MRVEAVERRGRQKYLDGGRDVFRLGSDGMSATLRVEFDVSARSGVDALKDPLDLPRRSGTQLNLAEREAELSIPAQPTRRQRLGHDALQFRTFGKNQLMVGRK